MGWGVGPYWQNYPSTGPGLNRFKALHIYGYDRGDNTYVVWFFAKDNFTPYIVGIQAGPVSSDQKVLNAKGVTFTNWQPIPNGVRTEWGGGSDSWMQITRQRTSIGDRVRIQGKIWSNSNPYTFDNAFYLYGSGNRYFCGQLVNIPRGNWITSAGQNCQFPSDFSNSNGPCGVTYYYRADC